MTWCWAFVVWVWISASQKFPLFWRKTHTKGLRTRFPTRPEEDEGRKIPGRTEVNRTSQSREETREETRAVGRTDQSTEVGGRWRSREAAARTCGLRSRVGQREKMSQHSFVSLWEFRSNIRCVSSQKHRTLGKCYKLLPSCAWS